MPVVSVIAPLLPVRRRTASIPQVVAGTLVSLLALLTVQLSALTAWLDTFGMPGGFRRDRVDELGQPLAGWSQLWHQFGPLLWAVHAAVLLGAVFWMWRTILTRSSRGAW